MNVHIVDHQIGFIIVVLEKVYNPLYKHLDYDTIFLHGTKHYILNYMPIWSLSNEINQIGIYDCLIIMEKLLAPLPFFFFVGITTHLCTYKTFSINIVHLMDLLKTNHFNPMRTINT